MKEKVKDKNFLYSKMKESLIEQVNREKNNFKKEAKGALKELCSKNWYKQIPNILTASRGIAPLVVFPILLTGNVGGAVIAEAIFAGTDFLDGKISRKFNLCSEFGKKLDTICDKIFAITLLLPVAFVNPIVYTTICLELSIGLINTNSLLEGHNPKSSIIGKVKTFILSASIILGYISMFTNIPANVLMGAYLTTLCAQSATVAGYCLTDIKARTKKQNKKDNNELIKDINNNNIEENKLDEQLIKELNNTKEKEVEYHNDFPPEENLNKIMKLRK